MKFSQLILLLALTVFANSAYAAKSCIVKVPQDCEVVGSNYSATGSDTTHVFQVDCKMRDGSLVKYMTTRQAISALLGVGRDFLPSKIVFAPADQDGISISCK